MLFIDEICLILLPVTLFRAVSLRNDSSSLVDIFFANSSLSTEIKIQTYLLFNINWIYYWSKSSNDCFYDNFYLGNFIFMYSIQQKWSVQHFLFSLNPQTCIYQLYFDYFKINNVLCNYEEISMFWLLTNEECIKKILALKFVSI